MHKKNLRQATYLTCRLGGHDLVSTFTDNCEKTVPDWIALLHETTLPRAIASSDSRFTAAFKAVDSVILRRQGTYLLRRLAYVQLMRLFGSLEAAIQSERRKGVHHASGYGNTSVAIDIYMNAQECQRGPNLRNKVVEQRRRMGKRVVAISGPSPLFLLVYSDTAESILYVDSLLRTFQANCLRNDLKTSNATLCLVATQIQQGCPEQLVHICSRLTEMAESAARRRCLLDMTSISAQIRRALLPK
jgi:hypothetical protein